MAARPQASVSVSRCLFISNVHSMTGLCDGCGLRASLVQIGRSPNVFEPHAWPAWPAPGVRRRIDLLFVSARNVARERWPMASPRIPRRRSRLACVRVRGLTCSDLGSDFFTPARLAFERPMAIACLVERAPCLPSRMCSISSRTNSPACVDGAFPSARVAPRTLECLSFRHSETSGQGLHNRARPGISPSRPADRYLR